MPTLNLGRVGFVNKLAWADGVHKINDVVTYNGGTYACILAHTSVAGNIIPTNVTYWIEWINPDVVHKTGDETIAGIKTFSSSPILPTVADGDSSTKGATTAFVASAIPYNTHAATSKTTPVDADEFPLIDSAASFGLKKLTGANLKAWLSSFFAPLLSPAFTGNPTAPTATAGTNTTQLATTAFVKTEIPNALNASGTAPIYACRAWVNFNGTGTVAIRASGNVSSITDNGIGDYTVNFTTSMPDVNYNTMVTTCNRIGEGAIGIGGLFGQDTGTVSAQRIRTFNPSVFEDFVSVNVSIFR